MLVLDEGGSQPIGLRVRFTWEPSSECRLRGPSRTPEVGWWGWGVTAWEEQEGLPQLLVSYIRGERFNEQTQNTCSQKGKRTV